MKRYLFVVALLFPSISFAVSKTAEEIVEKGLSAYKEEGAKAAIVEWIKGSGLENSKRALSQSNHLAQIEDYYGPYFGSEIIEVNAVSERSKMILFVINYENGIAYGRFQAYQSKEKGWVATEFTFHTEAALVWPADKVFKSCNK